MARRARSRDFRSLRTLLPDEVFLLATRKRAGPTDLVSQEVWHGLMHLPDDVALTTSNHHGGQLAALYALWGDWFDAMGDEQDELFAGMLDAADCLQASAFDALHGYYRSAVTNLRGTIELVVIGALGNIAPNDEHYRRWRKRKLGSLPFASCARKLRGLTKGTVPASIFKPGGWMEALYDELCAYAHSRPDASDGEMWRSNGPIYVASAFNKVFTLQVSTYAASYALAKVGRPLLAVPESSQFLFATPNLLWRDDIASGYRALLARQA
jgi:hypothetical protein